MPPSASVAEAEQVRAVEVPMLELGLMETDAIAGAVLPTTTDASPEAVPPSESVAVAVQVMVSSGELLAAERMSELPAPKLVPSVALLQA